MSSISVGWSKHDIFYFFGEKLSCSQSAGCYFETFYSIITIKTLIKITMIITLIKIIITIDGTVIQFHRKEK